MVLIPRIRFQEFSDGWKCTKMSSCIEEMVGGAPLTPKDILAEGDFKIIPKKAIQAGGKIIISDDCNYVKKDVYEKYNSNHAKKGDLIIVLRDLVPSGPSIGYIVENDKVEEGILAQGVYAFRTTGIIDNDFLIQYSNSPQYRKLMQTIMVGSTQVHIKNSVYMNIDMPLGELKEQQKIADFLSSVDDIIQVQKEEITALEEQKKGVMQKLFNREVRFKADDGSEYPEWEEKKLGDLFDISAGGDIDKDHSMEYQTERYCYPVFANALTDNGLYGYADYYKVTGNTITVTGRGDIGHAVARHCAYVPIVRLLVLTPLQKECVDFFANQINITKIFIESTGVPQLTSPQLKKIIVKRPVFEEQQKIADCLLAYDEAIQIKKDKLDGWKEIKKGLLQQMFV